MKLLLSTDNGLTWAPALYSVRVLFEDDEDVVSNGGDKMNLTKMVSLNITGEGLIIDVIEGREIASTAALDWEALEDMTL